MSNQNEFMIGSTEISITKLNKFKHLFKKRQTYKKGTKELIDWEDEQGNPEYLLDLTFFISQGGMYGSNVTFSISQTEEQRNAKEKKENVAYGKIFYTTSAGDSFKYKEEDKEEKVEETKPKEETIDEFDDLPF